MKRTFALALGFGLLASTLAIGQTGGPGGVGSVQQVGVIFGVNNQQQTYTAVPTIGDTSPTYLQTQSVTFPVTSAGTSIAPLDWKYGNIAIGEQPLILQGAAQQLCLNFNTISISSGVLNGSITWYEF